MTFVCDQCRRSVRGERHRTATRTLCQDCFDGFRGQAAGLMAGGGVPNAISTAGWLQRVRTAFRRGTNEGGTGR